MDCGSAISTLVSCGVDVELFKSGTEHALLELGVGAVAVIVVIVSGMLRLRSTIHRHHPPQRAVMGHICCSGERKVLVSQILLDGAEPRDAGTTWLSCPVRRRGD